MRTCLLNACCAVSMLPVLSLHAQQPAAEPLSSYTNTLGMKFLPVPGTTVLFSEFETRVSDFAAFLKDGGYNYPTSIKLHFEQTESHPAVNINLQDALAFCNWLSDREHKMGKLKPDQFYRLPSNSEWSIAAGLRADNKEGGDSSSKLQDTLRFVWGLQWPPPAGAGNFEDQEMKQLGGPSDEYRFTAPAGKFKPTADGLYDLAGNAWEWTYDREMRSTSVGTLRGGSWAYFKRECLTVQYIYEVPTELRAPTMGFRVVFEDKQRTASMLSAIDAARDREERERKQELMTKSKVDQKAVDKVLKTAGTTALPALDPATLAPAKADAPFMNALRMEFVPVPGIKALVGKTEVSRGQIDTWLKATGKTLTAPHFDLGSNDPVVNISWTDAVAWCAWLTEIDRKSGLLPPEARYRLPHDLEWSAAAGLTGETGVDPQERNQAEKTHYPWGEWPPQPLTANLDAPNVPKFSDSYSFVAPVNSMRANAFGIYHLGGNVSEWCDEAWPKSPDEYVIRGGSWIMSSPEALLTSARQHGLKSTTRYDLGFRCVVDFEAAKP